MTVCIIVQQIIPQMQAVGQAKVLVRAQLTKRSANSEVAIQITQLILVTYNILHYNMESHQESFQVLNKRYAKISLSKRKQLVCLVFQQHLSLRKAANRLRLKKSTAERIVNRYRKNGTFFEPKEVKKARIERQQHERERKRQLRAQLEPKEASGGEESHSKGHIEAEESERVAHVSHEAQNMPSWSNSPSNGYGVIPFAYSTSFIGGWWGWPQTPMIYYM